MAAASSPVGRYATASGVQSGCPDLFHTFTSFATTKAPVSLSIRPIRNPSILNATYRPSGEIVTLSAYCAPGTGQDCSNPVNRSLMWTVTPAAHLSFSEGYVVYAR